MAQNEFELNTVLMRSTFKIQGEDSIGTAFILGKPFENEPRRAHYVLITAGHVLEKMKGNSALLFLRKKRGNSFEKISHLLPIREGNKNLWVKHPDVDVAAMYVNLPGNIDIALLPTDILANDDIFEQQKIHPGDELFCLGYPLSLEANPAGFPILRSGKIASYPIIPAKETKSFLFDFEVFPGNSGGPVYFVQSGRTVGRTMIVATIQFIAGLVVQQKIVTQEIELLYGKQIFKYPLALGKVIHALFIKETIELLPPRQ